MAIAMSFPHQVRFPTMPDGTLNGVCPAAEIFTHDNKDVRYFKIKPAALSWLYQRELVNFKDYMAMVMNYSRDNPHISMNFKDERDAVEFKLAFSG